MTSSVFTFYQYQKIRRKKKIKTSNFTNKLQIKYKNKTKNTKMSKIIQKQDKNITNVLRFLKN